MNDRVNVGYKIIYSEKITLTTEIVIGYNPQRTFDNYVTWYVKNKDNYNHGHYFNKYIDALTDYHKRIIDELNYINDRISENY